MNTTFYDGTPIDRVDFEKEFHKELEKLELTLEELKKKEEHKINYHYWTLKLNRANKALEVGKVVLD